MRNFLNLTKINFKSILSSITNTISSKKGVKKSKSIASIIVMLLLIAGGIGYSMVNLYLDPTKEFAKYGLAHLVFYLSGIMSLVMVVFFVFVSCNGQVFKSKDYDMLSSLPIKNSHIVSAKLIAVLLTSYFYLAIAYFPALIVYFIYTSFNVGTFFLALLAYLFYPFLPTVLGILLGIAVIYLSTKFKHKSIAYIITSVLFLGVIAWLIYLAVDSAISVGDGGESLFKNIKYIFPTVHFFVEGFILKSPLNILYFMLVNLGAFALIVPLLSACYKKINNALLISKVGKLKNSLNFKTKSVNQALVWREFKHLFSSAVYFCNTVLLLIIFSFMPVLLKLCIPSGIISAEPEIANLILSMSLLFTVIMVGSSNVSAPSISVEGKTFYLLKSLPLSTKQVLGTKVWFNVLTAYPFALFSNILFLALFPNVFFGMPLVKNIIYVLLMFLLPFVVCLAEGMFGLLINLKFPKLDAINETQAVKQNLSVFVCVFTSLMINLLIFILYTAILFDKINIVYYGLIIFAYYLCLNIILYILLKRKAKKLFNDIG